VVDLQSSGVFKGGGTQCDENPRNQAPYTSVMIS